MALRNPDDDATAVATSSLERANFPQDPAEFDSDPRISFSKLDNTFILETDDGQEFEFDNTLKRWIPTVDDALLEQQREAYKVQGVDDHEVATTQQLKKKRKQPALGDENVQKPKKSRVNTAVYVTSIPLDATANEIRDVFCKCGVIAEEIDSGRPRIKMYTDTNGTFKGEALIVYFRPESVNLAIQMLDESDFRLGIRGPFGSMRVQSADYSFKSQQEAPAKTNLRDKKKILKKTQKLNSKLADWDDGEPSGLPDSGSRWDKVVVLKHMFTLKEIGEDPAAILDIKDDIREECSKLGVVTNVVLFDEEPDGVVTVRFSEPDAARQCIQLMDGRFFAGTRVEAYIADGSEKFRKANERLAALESDDEEEESKRLDEFGSWLESESIIKDTSK